MRVPLAVRHLVSIPIRRVPVVIKSGPNAGRKWSIAASGHGVAEGRFELLRFSAFKRLIRPDDVVWDVGANHGYATLIAAAQVNSSGRVYAFEPAAYNRWYLRKHLEWNDAEAVEVQAVAIADYSGASAFGGTGSSAGFALGKGDEQVQVSTVSDLVAAGLRAPTLLKVDIEGAEASLLRGASTYLETAAALGELPLMLISVHSPALYRECLAMLAAAGYEVISSHLLDLIKTPWNEDPDLLAIPPGRDVSDDIDKSWFKAGKISADENANRFARIQWPGEGRGAR